MSQGVHRFAKIPMSAICQFAYLFNSSHLFPFIFLLKKCRPLSFLLLFRKREEDKGGNGLRTENEMAFMISMTGLIKFKAL